MTVDELLLEIFGGGKPFLYADFETWVHGSRRFKAFAIEYRTKIRAKLKNVRSESGMKDLRAELETAALLVQSERLAVAYETYAALKQRGPDFTVTWKTHTPFNVEVRRIRRIEVDDGSSDASMTKLMTVVCEKLGQMPPGIVNLLWLTGARELTGAELHRAAMMLRQLAEQQAQEYFTRRGFHSTADFMKQYHRLSGIVLHHAGGNAVWRNELARHPVPREIAAELQRLPRGTD